MVECPVCEEEMEEADIEFCDDCLLESSSCTITLSCSNEKCPMCGKEIEANFSYDGMINFDKKEIEEHQDEYKQRKVLEEI